MNPLLLTGTVLVTCALAFYTAAMATEQKTRRIHDRVLFFFGLGLAFDVTATCFMIAGSRHWPFTFHGLLGYSALAAMIIENLLIRRFRRNHGADVPVSLRLHRYSQLAYAWWAAAYFAGAFIAMHGVMPVS
ncbi:MAG: hypothetical protein V1913_02455 [Fibrobacterota bacterium]